MINYYLLFLYPRVAYGIFHLCIYLKSSFCVVYFIAVFYFNFQVERKRHIGNDIVNIIFIDNDSDTDGCDFVPNCIKSQFTRILF